MTLMTFTVITGMSGQGHRLFDQQLTLVFWKGPELTVLTLQCGTYQYYGSNRRHYTGLTSRLAGRLQQSLAYCHPQTSLGSVVRQSG